MLHATNAGYPRRLKTASFKEVDNFLYISEQALALALALALPKKPMLVVATIANTIIDFFMIRASKQCGS
ncbi:hypothetical protein DBZ36_19490 [Alginatibacterium sediminis]|uniref:Uncharacterized protein n=1 Tax=Alginatibacterium sediminis TaxID=2164068 RepID=A0A420E621_9ALTE|nr:hypothetical protein DBZ36_19490 [Alginatibacterium sediminis]